MAWTWRKRKTIIPGVRLNFGKKGISTTIGPRGASMTFGPNGTYLNTSIPGTGLYNRQKIGGNNMNNTPATTENSGCEKVAIDFLSIIMWIHVILLALLGFFINLWVGCVFVGVVILTHIIVEIVANHIYKRREKEIKTDEIITTKNQSVENTPVKNTDQISREYYNQINKIVDDLYQDYIKILRLKDIDTLVDAMGVTFTMNDTPIMEAKEKVRLSFWVDVTRCYIGLGHDADLNSKEGLGLMYFLAYTNGCSLHQPYENRFIIKSLYQKKSENILKGIKAYIDATPAMQEVFLICKLLATKHSELHRKFLVDIYRFASMTAKADNIVTKEEAEWLSNIMKLQENGNQASITEDEYEEEKDDIPYIHFVLTEGSSRLDPLFADVARYVVAKQEGSTSRLQRAFEIGFNRAGKLSEQLEAAGIVGPNRGPTGRKVLIQDMNQLEKILENITGRVDSPTDNPAQAQKPSELKYTRTTTSPAKQLESLIGLESVKKEVETLSNFVKIQQTREAKGLKTSSVSYHCVFTGNPGTGKTTVARILAKIYKDLGVVTKGHLVETDRAGLVAEYVGQTAVKTNKIIDSALDGVLFIDEAYSLISKSDNDYGKEAIATLLKRMEDNRDRLIVILAGYTKEMKDFIDSNPGLQSRFNRYIEFPDYSAGELLQIFEANMKKYDYYFGEGAREYLLQYFTNEVANKDVNFGNARLVRNVFEKTLERQANRLAPEVNLTDDKISQIEIVDLPK